MTVLEQVKVEKLKVSLKECLLNYHVYYLSDFQKRWKKIPAVFVVQAAEELQRENFLTIAVGHKGATLLRLKDSL
jgi:hypothetical protein